MHQRLRTEPSGTELLYRAQSSFLAATPPEFQRPPPLVDPLYFESEGLSSPSTPPARKPLTLGTFLAGRLADLGVNHMFYVPGDFSVRLPHACGMRNHSADVC